MYVLAKASYHIKYLQFNSLAGSMFMSNKNVLPATWIVNEYAIIWWEKRVVEGEEVLFICDEFCEENFGQIYCVTQRILIPCCALITIHTLSYLFIFFFWFFPWRVEISTVPVVLAQEHNRESKFETQNSLVSEYEGKELVWIVIFACILSPFCIMFVQIPYKTIRGSPTKCKLLDQCFNCFRH